MLEHVEYETYMQRPGRYAMVCMSDSSSLLRTYPSASVNHRFSSYGTSCQPILSGIIYLDTFPTSYMA